MSKCISLWLLNIFCKRKTSLIKKVLTSIGSFLCLMRKCFFLRWGKRHISYNNKLSIIFNLNKYARILNCKTKWWYGYSIAFWLSLHVTIYWCRKGRYLVFYRIIDVIIPVWKQKQTTYKQSNLRIIRKNLNRKDYSI